MTQRKPTKPKASGAAGADATTLDDADRLAALEARLVRALRRYLAPELASRVAREAILAVTEPEPERDEEFTEAERAAAAAAWLRVGKVRRATR